MPLVTVTASDALSFGDFAAAGKFGQLKSVPQFPLSLVGTADLLDFANSFPSDGFTTLPAPILSTDATINVAAGTGQYLRATENFEVSIDDEIIFVKSRSGDVLSNCVRGAEGTTAAFHDTSSAVQLLITAKSHNQVAAELFNLEQYLSGSFTVEVPSTTRGNFSLPHGLSRAPRKAAIQMTSDGLIYWQTPRFDAVNLNLTASNDGLTAVVEVWP